MEEIFEHHLRESLCGPANRFLKHLFYVLAAGVTLRVVRLRVSLRVTPPPAPPGELHFGGVNPADAVYPDLRSAVRRRLLCFPGDIELARVAVGAGESSVIVRPLVRVYQDVIGKDSFSVRNFSLSPSYSRLDDGF